MLAIELSTSSDWAREMRGTASIASAVIGRPDSFSTRSGFSAGASRLTSVEPSAIRAISSSDGAFTLKTMSLRHTSSAVPIVAPAAAYASSTKLDASPAPDSTVTS